MKCWFWYINCTIRHCGLEELVHAFDGTGCEFKSWQSIFHRHRACVDSVFRGVESTKIVFKNNIQCTHSLFDTCHVLFDEISDITREMFIFLWGPNAQFMWQYPEPHEKCLQSWVSYSWNTLCPILTSLHAPCHPTHTYRKCNIWCMQCHIECIHCTTHSCFWSLKMLHIDQMWDVNVLSSLESILPQ